MRRALATIDLECVRHNVNALRQRLSRGCSLMAVVKANGYGHGAVQVARTSIDAGATTLGVATAVEAVELREAGLSCPIVILGPLTSAEAQTAIDCSAEVILWTPAFLKTLVHLNYDKDSQLGVHVKLDTGMRRLGVYPRRLPDLLDLIESEPAVKLVGLMTHFATADEDDEDFLSYQLGVFEEATQVVLRTGTRASYHCANSAATLRYPESHFDMVRCGIAIYGLSPFQGDAASDGLRPALALSSYLADIKPLIEGDAVGYGRTWTAPATTTIGVVPIGYGDGFSRRLSNQGRVLINGSSYRIVGRVSMDQITVDLGPAPEIQAGAEVSLIGSQGDDAITAEEMALMLDTINYEITCNISCRVERRYTE
ncbi:MAG: alanine racemase [Thermoleophilia bacterium]